MFELSVSRYKTWCKTQKNTREFHLYCWDHVCKVNEWRLVDSFRREFRVSTQIMVRDYCIAKCKMFSTCDGLLMTLRAIFFAIQTTLIRTLAFRALSINVNLDISRPVQIYLAILWHI